MLNRTITYGDLLSVCDICNFCMSYNEIQKYDAYEIVIFEYFN